MILDHQVLESSKDGPWNGLERTVGRYLNGQLALTDENFSIQTFRKESYVQEAPNCIIHCHFLSVQSV